MSSNHRYRERHGERFWRAHHEAWKQSSLNQRQYCELHDLSQKAFENWRQKFRKEPEPLKPKLLYRRGGLSHRLSHTVSHSLSHMTSEPLSRPIVPPPREGQRRAFSEEDKRRIVEEATRPGAALSAVARHYGIAPRVLFRWKEELAAAAPVFVSVEITHAPAEEQTP